MKYYNKQFTSEELFYVQWNRDNVNAETGNSLKLTLNAIGQGRPLEAQASHRKPRSTDRMLDFNDLRGPDRRRDG